MNSCVDVEAVLISNQSFHAFDICSVISIVDNTLKCVMPFVFFLAVLAIREHCIRYLCYTCNFKHYYFGKALCARGKLSFKKSIILLTVKYVMFLLFFWCTCDAFPYFL